MIALRLFATTEATPDGFNVDLRDAGHCCFDFARLLFEQVGERDEVTAMVLILSVDGKGTRWTYQGTGS